MRGAPLCSVIVVNWNGRDLLGPCLQGLREQRQQDFEVLLVDNASSDGSAAWVRAHFPEVRVIENARNLGFAGGANVGFAASQGEYLVVLNNDTRPEPQFLEALVDAAQGDARIGMVAGVLVFAHRPEYIASAGIRMQWDGVAIDYLAGQPRSLLPAAPVEVFGPSGGAALYRRAMLREIGPFREDLFAYLEDAELAWRARLAGWRCLLAPKAIVHHVYSATSGLASPFKSFQLARNRLLLLFLAFPAGLWLRFAPFIAAYDLFACLYGLLSGDVQVVRGRLAALHALPRLWEERRALQQRRRVSLRELVRLLDPPMAPWSVLQLRRKIECLAG